MNIFAIYKEYKFYLFALLLFFGFLLVFIGNFFGIDLSDEGLAVLSFVPEQKSGINFIHYHLVIQKLFPDGLTFVAARQIRFFLIISSNILLIYSLFKTKIVAAKKHVLMLIAATTLISLGTGIQVLSYNGLNQFIITIYVATLIQLFDKHKTKFAFLWLILANIFLSVTYLIRLPSFIMYIPLHLLALAIITKWKIKDILLYTGISLATVILSLAALGYLFVPISKVFIDVQNYAKLAPKNSESHGLLLIFQYLYDFIEKCILLFFTALSSFVLLKYVNRVKHAGIQIVFKILLIFAIVLMIISKPISVGSVFVFLFFYLLISFIADKKSNYSWLFEQRTQLLVLFPLFAIGSTIGSNVWIINLLLFYLSVWSVSFVFFLTKKNTLLFHKITYALVIIAVLKVTFTAFINPHRQGSLLEPHFRYEISDERGSILLDADMFAYVQEIREYLLTENQNEKEIIAVSRLPGLIYLLDSTSLGSINFTDAYWEVFCVNLENNVSVLPVVIFRGNIPDELIACLKDNSIDLDSDYKLGKTIYNGYRSYRMPTYIYIPIEEK